MIQLQNLRNQISKDFCEEIFKIIRGVLTWIVFISTCIISTMMTGNIRTPSVVNSNNILNRAEVFQRK